MNSNVASPIPSHTRWKEEEKEDFINFHHRWWDNDNDNRSRGRWTCIYIYRERRRKDVGWWIPIWIQSLFSHGGNLAGIFDKLWMTDNETLELEESEKFRVFKFWNQKSKVSRLFLSLSLTVSFYRIDGVGAALMPMAFKGGMKNVRRGEWTKLPSRDTAASLSQQRRHLTSLWIAPGHHLFFLRISRIVIITHTHICICIYTWIFRNNFEIFIYTK